jgi:hypothetical protein
MRRTANESQMREGVEMRKEHAKMRKERTTGTEAKMRGKREKEIGIDTRCVERCGWRALCYSVGKLGRVDQHVIKPPVTCHTMSRTSA